MSKFKTIGAVKENKNGNLYIAVDKMALKDLPKNDKGEIFLNLGVPRKGKEQSEESYTDMLKWKKYDIYVKVEE